MQYIFPGWAVFVDERAHYVETRFPDGTKVGSTPNRDPHTLSVAADLGYGDDTWAMSRDHEMGHSWLALLAGLPWSPTIWRLAHPYGPDLPDDAEVAEEEAGCWSSRGPSTRPPPGAGTWPRSRSSSRSRGDDGAARA